jgi:hypothetical protein
MFILLKLTMKLKLSDFTYKFEVTPGIRLYEGFGKTIDHNGNGRAELLLEEVYTGQVEHNPGRVQGALRSNVSRITESLNTRGVDYSLPVPVVEKLKTPIVANGKKYEYRLIDGVNRFKSFLNNGYTYWVFDVIEIGVGGVSYEYALETFAQIRNDHAPNSPHSVEDIHASAARLIGSGDLDDNEDSIRDWVYLVAKNVPTQTKNQIVSQIIKDNEIPTATSSWTDKTATAWAQQPDTKLPVDPDYFFPGHYFQDRIFALMKQYSETKQVQNVYVHVSGGSEENILNQREKTLEQFDNFEQILRDVSSYVLLNGELPFNIVGFVPQINDKEDPTTYVAA